MFYKKNIISWGRYGKMKEKLTSFYKDKINVKVYTREIVVCSYHKQIHYIEGQGFVYLVETEYLQECI